MRKSVLLVLILVLAFIATLGFAQEGPPEEQGPRAIQVVARYLELTPEQVEAWVGLMESLRNELTVLSEEVALLEEQLHGAIQEPEPDPVLVGELVIQIHSLRDGMRRHTEVYQEAFEDLLTDDQLIKFAGILEAMELQRFIPAFRVTHLI